MSVLEELEGAIQTAAERFGPAVIGLGHGWGRGSVNDISPSSWKLCCATVCGSSTMP